MTDGRPSPAAPEPAEQVPSPSSPPASVGPLGVLASVFRAWFGVQSDDNRRRDFTHGNPQSFIIAGIIFVIVMVIAVMMTVNAALSASQ